jgi:membrane protease YdiL (CAAX protease family)
MRTFSSLIKSQPLVIYFVLAYSISWIFVPLATISPAFALPALFGPAVAAILVTGILEGWTGQKALLRRVVQWRVGWPWYLVALLLPPLVVLAVWGVTNWLGAQSHLRFGGMMALVFAPFYVGEELGWRGFALPRLLHGRSPLVASLILGLLWAGWHLPNFLIPIPGIPPLGPFAAFVVWVVAQTVVFTWLFQRAKGSVLLTTLMHAAINALGVAGTNLITIWWEQAAAWMAVALLALFVVGQQPFVKRLFSAASNTERM